MGINRKNMGQGCVLALLVAMAAGCAAAPRRLGGTAWPAGALRSAPHAPLAAPSAAGPQLTRVADGARLGLAELAQSLPADAIVLVGEKHDSAAHHALQLELVKALIASGRQVAIALEPIRASGQRELDAWSAGTLTGQEFLAFYQSQWSEEYQLYAGLFGYARQQRLPLIGLNVERASIAAIKRAATKPYYGETPLEDDYLVWLYRAAGTHAGSAPALAALGRAMRAWNQAMAKNLAVWVERHPGYTVVVVAGGGHARKGWGIGRELPEKLASRARVVMPADWQGFAPAEAVASVADYVAAVQ